MNIFLNVTDFFGAFISSHFLRSKDRKSDCRLDYLKINVETTALTTNYNPMNIFLNVTDFFGAFISSYFFRSKDENQIAVSTFKNQCRDDRPDNKL